MKILPPRTNDLAQLKYGQLARYSRLVLPGSVSSSCFYLTQNPLPPDYVRPMSSSTLHDLTCSCRLAAAALLATWIPACVIAVI